MLPLQSVPWGRRSCYILSETSSSILAVQVKTLVLLVVVAINVFCDKKKQQNYLSHLASVLIQEVALSCQLYVTLELEHGLQAELEDQNIFPHSLVAEA